MLYKFCRFGFMQTSSKAYGIRFFQRYIKMHRVFVLSIICSFYVFNGKKYVQSVGCRIPRSAEGRAMA